MRVLVIPEDFRNDQYILKPLFERLVAAIRQKCPEDFDALARRIETVFGANR